MCEFSVSGRLVAWMDRELPENQAADVERHVRECSECLVRVDAYEQASRAVVAYCDAAMEQKTRRRLRGWVPLLASAAAAMLVFVLHPTAAKQMAVPPQVADTAPAAVVETETAETETAETETAETETAETETAETETAPRPLKRAHRRHGIAPMKTPNMNWASAEPAIQIAIPIDAMFPPGAVPEGITFIADMAADGSVLGLRLQ